MLLFAFRFFAFFVSKCKLNETKFNICKLQLNETIELGCKSKQLKVWAGKEKIKCDRHLTDGEICNWKLAFIVVRLETNDWHIREPTIDIFSLCLFSAFVYRQKLRHRNWKLFDFCFVFCFYSIVAGPSVTAAKKHFNRCHFKRTKMANVTMFAVICFDGFFLTETIFGRLA